jgi:hypothetical protein
LNISAESKNFFKNLVLQALETIRIQFLQKKDLQKFHACAPFKKNLNGTIAIAIGILETIDRKLPVSDLRFSLTSKKRGRDGGREHSTRDYRRSVYRSDRDLSSSSYSSRSDRDQSHHYNHSRSNRDLSNSSYMTYPGDFHQQRDKYPRRGGSGGGNGGGSGNASPDRY